MLDCRCRRDHESQVPPLHQTSSLHPSLRVFCVVQSSLSKACISKAHWISNRLYYEERGYLPLFLSHSVFPSISPPSSLFFLFLFVALVTACACATPFSWGRLRLQPGRSNLFLMLKVYEERMDPASSTAALLCASRCSRPRLHLEAHSGIRSGRKQIMQREKEERDC